MKFNDIEELKHAGFSGFASVASLTQSGCAEVPEQRGVYMILNQSRKKSFLEVPVGNQDETKFSRFSISELNNKWVKDTIVVYIGQTAQTLKKRIRAYMRRSDEHSGGRLIWYLKNHNELLVCYMPKPTDNPRAVEKSLLTKFKSHYDKWPFANLKG